MDRIKESFDSLPIAACFFDKNGVVRLINRRMLAITNWLQKGGIQSLAEMQSALQAPPGKCVLSGSAPLDLPLSGRNRRCALRRSRSQQKQVPDIHKSLPQTLRS